jgi:oligoendopeptidase F
MNNEFFDLYTRLSGYAGLITSVDVKNEAAQQYEEKIDQQVTELTEPRVTFEKWLISLDNLDGIIGSSDYLKEHRFYLNEIVSKGKYLLSEREEAVIARMKNTGSNAWTRLHKLLTSTLLVDITVDGQEKQLPLPIVRNMAYSSDANLRKTAYDAELKSYKKIDEACAACLNGIKGEVITLSRMRGYNSPLEKTLIDSRMEVKTLESMISAMKESLPAFHKYFRKKGELLGYKNGLPFYDVFAPVGSVDMEFTYEEARNFVVRNFRTFSSRLADFADNAFEKRWIDAEPREGKRGGAFCSNLHVIKESRIMANFNGSFSNMTTLAHELGHGYHGSCLSDETYINSEYPMPIAETASIFCETIVTNAALKSAGMKKPL